MLLYNRSLDSIIVSLDPSRFFRANKQYIVARDSVKEIVVWFDNRLFGEHAHPTARTPLRQQEQGIRIQKLDDGELRGEGLRV